MNQKFLKLFFRLAFTAMACASILIYDPFPTTPLPDFSKGMPQIEEHGGNNGSGSEASPQNDKESLSNNGG